MSGNDPVAQVHRVSAGRDINELGRPIRIGRVRRRIEDDLNRPRDFRVFFKRWTRVTQHVVAHFAGRWS